MTDPAGVSRVLDAPAVNVGGGVFSFSWLLPADAPPGTWSAKVSVVDGSRTGMGSADFGVRAVAPPTPDPDPSEPHGALRWSDYPANCLSCHPQESSDAYQGLHYQWQGSAPQNVNKPTVPQGKLTNEINSYCVNILGNWGICGRCHAGRGQVPVRTDTPTNAQLLNVDCLVCHNEAYANARTRLADGSMGPSTTDPAVLDGYVRKISAPTRAVA